MNQGIARIEVYDPCWADPTKPHVLYVHNCFALNDKWQKHYLKVNNMVYSGLARAIRTDLFATIDDAADRHNEDGLGNWPPFLPLTIH